MRKLDLTLRSKKFLENLPPKPFRQIVSKVFALLVDPQPPDSKALSGFPYRRTDIGEYRIIYRIEGDVLRVALISKRNDDEIYRDVQRLQ